LNELQHIPMPVLYGVFLYMGVSSLHGIQASLINLFKQLLSQNNSILHSLAKGR